MKAGGLFGSKTKAKLNLNTSSVVSEVSDNEGGLSVAQKKILAMK